MNWKETKAAVWRPKQQSLKGISQTDPISLDQLIGIDKQKAQLVENTERFINNSGFNNALLWGSRGTGKSSLVKATFNQYQQQGLRIIEVFKEDLYDLHDIVDQIRDQAFHFVIYCDDFAFSQGDNSYSNLKSVLEGSLEAPPSNVVLYATSNRRHVVPQTMQENLNSKVVNGELHLSDAIEEKIALSDRFGLRLSFHPISQAQYLDIIDGYFSGLDHDQAELHEAAIAFAHEHASRSGRTAKHFFNSYAKGSR